MRHVVFHPLHPAAIARAPRHRDQLIQSLQAEEEYEAESEPRMQHAGHGSAAEQGSEPAEDPRHVDSEARDQCEEEKDSVSPVQEARVGAVAQEFSDINDGQPSRLMKWSGPRPMLFAEVAI
jgi:hypothetical protein